MATQQRRPTASDVLGHSFGRSNSGSVVSVAAPECSGLERLGELSITVESPPLRVGPPGHESFVRLSDVKDDPNQVLIDCEEYGQERDANLKSAKGTAGATEDEVTLFDPNEALLDEVVKEVDLRGLINKCLRNSVRLTRTADRTVRLSGLRALRQLSQGQLNVTACSNREAEDEDDDEDVPDD